MNNRYFIVFLKYYMKNKQGNACISYITANGRYLNRTETTRYAEKELKIEKSIITNIIELSESDYDDFIENDDNFVENDDNFV